MKTNRNDAPLVRDELGEAVKGEEWGPFAAAFMSFPSGTDFGPLLKGLPGDHCQCPHWGYVTQGSIKVSYQDGTSETINAGDLYHFPPGHSVRFDEDTSFVEFSPKDELGDVLAHCIAKMG